MGRTLIAPDWPLAMRHARGVALLERSLHLAWERPVQAAFLADPAVVQALNVVYVVAHVAVTAVFFVWLYGRSRAAFCRFRNAFLVATTVALVLHWGFPTAPPRLAGIGLADTLRMLAGIDIGSPGSAGLSDPVAALPSLHAGFALGVGVGIVRYARAVGMRLVGAAYPGVIVLTVIVTGNHFVLDTVAGMAVMGLGFAVTDRRVATLVLRRGVEQSGSSPGS